MWCHGSLYRAPLQVVFNVSPEHCKLSARIYENTRRHNAKGHKLRWPSSPTIHICRYPLKSATTILFRPLQTEPCQIYTMLYLNTLLKELGNRYGEVPRAFFCTNVDCENDHMTPLRTKTSIPGCFKKCITKRHILMHILTNHKPLLTENVGRFTNTRLSRRFWKEALK